MEIISVVQYVLCLLVQCSSSNDGPPNNEPAAAAPVGTSSSLTTTRTTTATSTGQVPSPNEVNVEVVVATANLSNSMSNDVLEVLRNDRRLVRDKRDVDFSSIQQVQQMSEQHANESRRDLNRLDGRACTFNADCRSGCCLVRSRESTARRECSPLVARGGRCEIGQIKGGAYAYFCPCSAGEAACELLAISGDGERYYKCTQ